MSAQEPTLHVEPLQASTKQGQPIGVKLVFLGGATDTTLILPMGADASGIITYQLTNTTTRATWTAALKDERSFAADNRRPLPAGGKIELTHDTLVFERPGGGLEPELPAGRWQIVAIHDEGHTFRLENRTGRVLRSPPVEIVVDPRP
jgi:hypothetical protein